MAFASNSSVRTWVASCDIGYAAGAVVGGVAADLWGIRAAVWAAAITVVSGVVVAMRMYETHP